MWYNVCVHLFYFYLMAFDLLLMWLIAWWVGYLTGSSKPVQYSQRVAELLPFPTQVMLSEKLICAINLRVYS